MIPYARGQHTPRCLYSGRARTAHKTKFVVGMYTTVTPGHLFGWPE